MDLAQSLQGHALFSTASYDFIVQLASKMKVRSFKPGDVIIREGDPGKAMFFLLKGSVTVLSGSDNEVVLETLHAGMFFGEISMLFNIPRTASIIAKTKSVVCTLTSEELNKILAHHPDISEHIRKEAVKRLEILRQNKEMRTVDLEKFKSRGIKEKLAKVRRHCD